jgi:hypothetical protein
LIKFRDIHLIFMKNVSGPFLIYLVTALIACSPLSVDAQQPENSPATQQDAGQAKRQHPAQSAAAQAGDPTAPLLQLQFTDFFAPSNHNADDFSNLFNVEPVLPIAASKKFPIEQIMRPTVPVITMPNPGRETGLGDIGYLHLFVPKPRKWGMVGAGLTAVLPTATDDTLGSGKFQLGPAFTFMYYKIKNWQLGGLFQNPISIGGEGSREDVNVLQIQPIVNYIVGDWYFGAGDFNASIDWETGDIALPLAFQVGNIISAGKYQYNVSVELEWTAVYPDDVVVPRWGIRLGFVWMIPER